MRLEDLNLIFIDVEATGSTPASGVMTEFGAVHYWTRKSFHGILWEAIPDPECPAKPLIQPGAAHYPEVPVMRSFSSWASSFPGRPVAVSDNIAYDFMWLAYYLDKNLREVVLGHSGRRISDFWAGLKGDFTQTQKWKSLRVTPHTHMPVDDAMGNVEAFEAILASIKAN